VGIPSGISNVSFGRKGDSGKKVIKRKIFKKTRKENREI
jgi:hypothetical protein